MMSAAVAGTTFRPTPSYTTLRDVTAAARLAIRQPDRVDGVVLVNSGGFQRSNPFGRWYCRRIMGSPRLSRWILPAFVRAYMRPQSELDDAIMSEARRSARTPEGVALSSSMWRSFGDPGHDLTAHGTRLTAPTLLVWGRKDRAVPLSIGKATAEAIRGSQLRLLDTGHVPFASRPQAFLEAVGPFLLGLGTPAAPEPTDSVSPRE